jgi:hypothetical protein
MCPCVPAKFVNALVMDADAAAAKRRSVDWVLLRKAQTVNVTAVLCTATGPGEIWYRRCLERRCDVLHTLTYRQVFFFFFFFCLLGFEMHELWPCLLHGGYRESDLPCMQI